MPAIRLISRPIKVSALGEILVSARPWTILYSSHLLDRPTALVQVMTRLRLVVDGSQLQHLKFALAGGRDYLADVSHLLAHQGAADRRAGGDQSLGHVRLFAGDQLVRDFLFLRRVVNH